jgi:hypothetical protein
MSHQTTQRLSVSRRNRPNKISAEEFQFHSKTTLNNCEIPIVTGRKGVLLIARWSFECWLLINANRVALQLDKSSLTPKKTKPSRGEKITLKLFSENLSNESHAWTSCDGISCGPKRELKFNLIYWDGKRVLFMGVIDCLMRVILVLISLRLRSILFRNEFLFTCRLMDSDDGLNYLI